MSATLPNGTIREVNGKRRIYYDGYWIRFYAPPKESFAAKRQLIDRLKKRLFHHTEPGINTPGERLEAARKAYEEETDPKRRRVNGAMLAGALFNRATDIFDHVVALAEKGYHISPDNELMKQCGDYFHEAIELGRLVKHASGHEGVDELWGEPFKAFAMPIAEFYETRYRKIAQTMRDIDRVTEKLVWVFAGDPLFAPACELVRDFGEASKLETETMRSDRAIFQVWPRYVAAGEGLLEFAPRLGRNPSVALRHQALQGSSLLADGKHLITYLAGVRAPMPKSTEAFLSRCDAYANAYHIAA